MKKIFQFLRKINLIFGFLAVGALMYSFFVLIKLWPKMVKFASLSDLELNLMTGVGLSLLILLVFFILSLLQIARFIKHRDRIGFFPWLLVISGVLSLLFVFSDIALLNDINKQYRHNLSQPEWAMLFPFLAAQAVIVLLFVYLHLSGYFLSKQLDKIVHDVNIYLIVQMVGLISGGMGLAMASLGFFYHNAWSLAVHSVMAGLTILFPYALVVLFWAITRFREKTEAWWDEKQLQDMGKSALLTLLVVTVLMIGLFVFNLRNLGGVVRMLWLPLYLFACIFIFSLGNLTYSSRG